MYIVNVYFLVQIKRNNCIICNISLRNKIVHETNKIVSILIY